MREGENDMWVWRQGHMGRSGEGLGTVQVRWRCTGVAGEGVAILAGKMAASVMDMEEDFAALFGVDDDFEDDDFSDDDSKGVKKEEPPSVYEVGGPSTMDAKGPFFSLPAHGLSIPPSVIKDLSTHLGNLEYGYRQLV
nr:hypothetical protein [Tanacetum cinerariifolium]